MTHTLDRVRTGPEKPRFLVVKISIYTIVNKRCRKGDDGQSGHKINQMKGKPTWVKEKILIPPRTLTISLNATSLYKCDRGWSLGGGNIAWSY